MDCWSRDGREKIDILAKKVFHNRIIVQNSKCSMSLLLVVSLVFEVFTFYSLLKLMELQFHRLSEIKPTLRMETSLSIFMCSWFLVSKCVVGGIIKICECYAAELQKSCFYDLSGVGTVTVLLQSLSREGKQFSNLGCLCFYASLDSLIVGPTKSTTKIYIVLGFTSHKLPLANLYNSDTAVIVLKCWYWSVEESWMSPPFTISRNS